MKRERFTPITELVFWLIGLSIILGLLLLTSRGARAQMNGTPAGTAAGVITGGSCATNPQLWVIAISNTGVPTCQQVSYTNLISDIAAVTGVVTVAQSGTPTGLTVTPTGGSATQYCYRAACNADTGSTVAEAEVCDAAGPTTLSVTNFETVAVTFPEVGCDHMTFYGRSTGAELKTSTCPGGTNCIAAAGGKISWKDDGSQTPSGALPASNTTGAQATRANISAAATVTCSANNYANTLGAASSSCGAPVTANTCTTDQYVTAIAAAGTSTCTTTVPYDVGFSIIGTPSASEIVPFMLVRTISFGADFSGSAASCGTNPGETDDYLVKCNGSQIGDVSLSTSCVATFSTSSHTTQSCASQRLELDAPGTVSGANIGITLKGTR